MGSIESQISNPVLGPVFALLAGILTSASPCAVGALPLVIGHMAQASRKKRVRDLALFTSGMTLTFTGAGLAAGIFGRSLTMSAPWLRPLAGAGFVALGLSYLGVLGGSKTCPTGTMMPAQNDEPSGERSWVAGISMGFLYGVSASPCATPALIAILAVVAATGSAGKGALLLLAYSLGQSLLVIAAGLATSRFRDFLAGRKAGVFLARIRQAGGAIILATGLYMIASYVVSRYL